MILYLLVYCTCFSSWWEVGDKPVKYEWSLTSTERRDAHEYA